MKNPAVVILAAGQGTRMKSSTPKVLHTLVGRPLLSFPLALAHELKADKTVVVLGHERGRVEAKMRSLQGGAEAIVAVQEEQKGTGHAVQCALAALGKHSGPVLILYGDVPLLDKPSITRLRKAFEKSGEKIAFMTFEPPSPTGYGRVIRQGGTPVAIREHKDCSAAERKIAECNAGTYLIDAAFLKREIRKLSSDNKQGELYLTDLVEIAAARGTVGAAMVAPEVVGGINDRVDLTNVEALLRRRINEKLLRAGVTVRMPETVHVDHGVKVVADTEIEPGVQLKGATRIGRNVRVETGAVIVDSEVADGAVIKAYSVLEEAKVGPAAEIGPMGRLRPGAIIERGAKVGNFVELKKTRLGPGAKANHLAYLGDGDIGAGCNIGAGTIFCNYDGYSKHPTILEENVFIGSDSQLVAPVRIGKGAYVASGSTVTRDVPADALAISRTRQENKKGLAAALRARLASLKAKAQQAKK